MVGDVGVIVLARSVLGRSVLGRSMLGRIVRDRRVSDGTSRDAADREGHHAGLLRSKRTSPDSDTPTRDHPLHA